MDAPPQLPSTTSSVISACDTLSDLLLLPLHLILSFFLFFLTSFSQSYHIPRGAPSSVLHSASHHPFHGTSSHSHGEVLSGLFHLASGKVALRSGKTRGKTCIHTVFRIAWGRGLVARDLGVPARPLVRLPEVATRWVRSLHLIQVMCLQRRLTAAFGSYEQFCMLRLMGVSAPSLHRESTDSLIYSLTILSFLLIMIY